MSPARIFGAGRYKRHMPELQAWDWVFKPGVQGRGLEKQRQDDKHVRNNRATVPTFFRAL